MIRDKTNTHRYHLISGLLVVLPSRPSPGRVVRYGVTGLSCPCLSNVVGSLLARNDKPAALFSILFSIEVSLTSLID